MIIGIDGNEANITHRVGVGQFAFQLINSLYRLDNVNKYLIYLKSPPLPDMPPPRANWQYHVFGPSRLWTKFALPLKLLTQKQKLDLFYSPSHYSPHFSPFPTIPTIHDLGYLDFQSQFTRKDLYQLINWTERSIYKAKQIVAVSEFTKSEISKIYGVPSEKISIVFNGVGDIKTPSATTIENTLQKFSISAPYILYLGTLKPNKNIPFLIKGFAKLIKTSPKFSKYILVVAGKKGWLFDEIFDTVKSLKLTNKVIFTDYLTEEEKWSLVSKASLMVLPSTYEGFGIPAIEAIKAKVPLIVSDIPPFREVTGGTIPLINPQDIKEFVSTSNKLLNNEIKIDMKKAQSYVSRFTWDNSAKSLLSVFEKTVSTK